MMPDGPNGSVLVYGFTGQLVGYALPLEQADPSKPGWDFTYRTEADAEQYGTEPKFKGRLKNGQVEYIELLPAFALTKEEEPPAQRSVFSVFTPEMIGKVVELKRTTKKTGQKIIVVGVLQQYSLVEDDLVACTFEGDSSEDAIQLQSEIYEAKIRVLGL